MKLAGLAIPGLIAAAAMAAIWYISKQNALTAVDPPSTAGNDTASPAIASGTNPNSTTVAGTTSTGTSATTLPANFGITNSSW